MKSKDQKRREAIDRMEYALNYLDVVAKGNVKNDIQRRKNLQKAIDNTKAKLIGGRNV